MSLFYAYRHLRQVVKRTYPSGRDLDNPTDVSQSISWRRLQEIRLQSDHEAANGYSYALIGNDSMVDKWIDYGIQEGLLEGFWRCELERLVEMERGPANTMLMNQLRFDQL